MAVIITTWRQSLQTVSLFLRFKYLETFILFRVLHLKQYESRQTVTILKIRHNRIVERSYT